MKPGSARNRDKALLLKVEKPLQQLSFDYTGYPGKAKNKLTVLAASCGEPLTLRSQPSLRAQRS